MSIHLHGKYKAGVIHPDQPLGLPDDSEIELVVTAVAVPKNGRIARPSAPKITAGEMIARLDRHAVAIGSLPADFSRADIYGDHD